MATEGICTCIYTYKVYYIFYCVSIEAGVVLKESC